MKIILRIVSYLFHPIFIPLVGSIAYFSVTARYFQQPVIQAKLLAIAIVTIFIPVVFFFLLKTLKLVQSIFLKTARERLFPLLLYLMILYFLVLKNIFDIVNFRELYFFFLGIMISTFTSLVLIPFKLKVSLHMVGIAGLTMYVTALSLHFKTNLLALIAFFAISCGLVASARLRENAHNNTEIIFGFFIGLLPQVLMLQYWL